MRFAAPILALAAVALAAPPCHADTVLTVMSFNAWGAGANDGRPIDATVAAIRAAGADIVGLQEVRPESRPCEAAACPPAGESAAARIAAALGFHHYDQAQANDALWANAILSRHPIGAATPHDVGVVIDVGGRTVYAFNVHLTDYPYQSYQLLGIAYGDAPFMRTAEEAAREAEAARGSGLALLLEDLGAADGADAAFVFGDFNEPSHRDWTERAAAAGRHPVAVRYPTARAVEARGFTDAFRSAHPDEIAKPGYTWTPTTRPDDPTDHHDRIDYVFVRGPGLAVLDAHVVGESAPAADVVVAPWTSDHRAVVATVRF